ncbi:MAG: serine/threonine-protein kinase [Myxococcota bacterium]
MAAPQHSSALATPQWVAAEVPERIGRFRVTSHLGRGGMADVFKCIESGRGDAEAVVVKRMLPHLARDPTLVSMFLREAEIAARLTHPNIVKIHGVARDHDTPFIVMEYVHGPTLAQLLTRSRERGERNALHVVHVLATLCEALDYLHGARRDDGQPLSVVHRDVTPPNIMLSTIGVPKLLDFGVAKSRGETRELLAGILKGKTPYIAPEQLAGLEEDARTDIYAVGVCLFVATTGELPFRGATEAEILRAIRSRAFARPTALVPGYSERLEEIVLWAMAPARDQRCPTAATLAHALTGYLNEVGYLSDTAALGHWVEALFPNASFLAMRARADTAPIFTTRPHTPTSPRRRKARSTRGRWLFAAGLATAGLAVIILLRILHTF